VKYVKATALALLIIALTPLVVVMLIVQLIKHADHIADTAYHAFGEWL